MAAVTLDVIQSGSTSATLHVENGDTITLELAETVWSNALSVAAAHLNALLSEQTGVTFAVNTTGGAT